MMLRDLAGELLVKIVRDCDTHFVRLTVPAAARARLQLISREESEEAQHGIEIDGKRREGDLPQCRASEYS